MGSDATRQRLEQIAKFVEDYPTIKQTDFQAWMSLVATPAQAMVHAADAVPVADREAVVRALPQIQTPDFAKAAREIRERAEALLRRGEEDSR